MTARRVAFVCGWLCLSSAAYATNDDLYVTWAGAEPDKGASMWLIKRYVSPNAEIRLIPVDTSPASGTAFDIPQARYRRTHRESTFESLLRDYPINDPFVEKIGQLMHDIEINLWRPKRFPESITIEAATKAIAEGYADHQIPVTCFVPLFDHIYTWLKSGHTEADLIIPAECKDE